MVEKGLIIRLGRGVLLITNILREITNVKY